MRLWQRRRRAECDRKPELGKVEKTWGRDGGGDDCKNAQHNIGEKESMCLLSLYFILQSLVWCIAVNVVINVSTGAGRARLIHIYIKYNLPPPSSFSSKKKRAM